MAVEVNIPPISVEFAAGIRRAMLTAADQTVLPLAVAGAPYEENPRHGYHLRDTAVSRYVGQIGGAEAVEVAFTAFWAGWQEENMHYHHTQGHAKFLELALAEGGDAWLAAVADQIRARFA